MVEGRKVGEREGERDTYTQPLVASHTHPQWSQG